MSRSPFNSRTKTKGLARDQVVSGVQIIRGRLAEDWDGNARIARVRLVSGGPSAIAQIALAGKTLFSAVKEGTQCTLRMNRGTLEITAFDSTQQTDNPLSGFERGVTATRGSNQTGVVTGTVQLIAFTSYLINDLGLVLFTSTSAIPSGGTVSKTAGNATITGSGTKFLTDLLKLELVVIPGGVGNDYVVIEDIISDTSCVVNPAPLGTASGQTMSFSNGGIPIPHDGWYHWHCGIAMNCANATGQRRIEVFRNNTRIAYIRRAAANTTEYLFGAGVTYCNKYDVLQFAGFQDSGANCSFDALEEYSPIAIVTTVAGH